MDKQPPAAPSPVTGPRLLLGAFILWQLTFLFGINFLEIINWARDEIPKDKDYAQGIERVFPGWPSESGHFHDLTDLADKITRRYAQLTGQTQGWSLFAPNIGRQIVFPAVLVRWDEDPSSALALSRPLSPLAATNPLEAGSLRAAGAAVQPAPVPAAPVTILSANEPKDIHSYFRVGNFRLRRLESNLTVVLAQGDEETPAEAAKRWRERINKLLDREAAPVQAYLRWRWDSYRKAHPEVPPPKQLILVMRRYAIVAPEKAPPYWEGPFTVPVARVQPQVQWAEDRSPLERYNPVTQRFQEVRP
jgi:hypothetical protein